MQKYYINIANIQGVTPLINAILQGKSEMAQFLLEKGADYKQADDNYHRTPIHMASLRGNCPVVKSLVEHGDDFGQRG